jgi:hypothetical protein
LAGNLTLPAIERLALGSLLIVALLVMVEVQSIEMPTNMLFPILMNAFAQTNSSTTINGTFPNIHFTDSDMAQAEKIALADSKVQQMIAGRPYAFSPSYSVSGNIYNPSNGADIVLNIDVANKDVIVVAVDLKSAKVVSTELIPGFANIRLGTAAATTVDRNSSSSDNFYGWLPLILFVSVLGGGLAASIALLKRRKIIQVKE